MRLLGRLLCLCCLHGLLLRPVEAAAESGRAKKPHIFLVLVDDWGWNNVGYHRQPNDPEVVTPNIDALARSGIELDRHYTYHYCSPSRSSLQSGRYATHIAYGHDDPLRVNLDDPVSGYSGLPRNITGLAEKLASAGYRTHMTGKWDAGMATWEQTPMGRGYETFFGYYHHAEDYYTQRLSDSGYKKDACGNMVDLWNTTGPARDRNGTAYVEEMFTENSLGVLDRHDPAEPLFLFHAFHLIHTPLQVPEEWEQRFAFLTDPIRRKYAAMVAYMDNVVGLLVAKFKAKGMWDDTLVVLSSDNGGPTYHAKPSIGHGGASNLPLRGGKQSDWEGGVRVNALVSGGFVPESRQGSKLQDFVHMADWYATFCALAGVSAEDERAQQAGLPPIDSIDQSRLLLGSEPIVGERQEIYHSPRALTQGRWKLITGGMQMLEIAQDYSGRWELGGRHILFSDYEPGYSNVSTNPLRGLKDCGRGCLYDIVADPIEASNVAKENREVVKAMKQRLQELNMGAFHPDKGKPQKEGCNRWSGFYGPWLGPIPSELSPVATLAAAVYV